MPSEASFRSGYPILSLSPRPGVLGNLALWQQVAVLNRRRPQPRSAASDRLFWVVLRSFSMGATHLSWKQRVLNCYLVLRRRGQSWTVLHQGDTHALFSRVLRLSVGDRGQLSRSRYHSFGDGQSLRAHPQGTGGPVRREGRRLVVGPIHSPLHAQTRTLAESGGDGGQPV